MIPLKPTAWFAYTSTLVLACLVGAGWGNALFPSPWGWLGGAATTNGFVMGLFVYITRRDPFTLSTLPLIAVAGLWLGVTAGLRSGLWIGFATGVLSWCGLVLLFVLAVCAGNELAKELARRKNA